METSRAADQSVSNTNLKAVGQPRVFHSIEEECSGQTGRWVRLGYMKNQSEVPSSITPEGGIANYALNNNEEGRSLIVVHSSNCRVQTENLVMRIDQSPN